MRLVAVSFQDGSKPEVVTLCTIVRWRLDFSIDSDSPDMYYVDQSKKGVSDNCGSYENRSYLDFLMTYFEKVDCSEISRWPSCFFQDG